MALMATAVLVALIPFLLAWALPEPWLGYVWPLVGWLWLAALIITLYTGLGLIVKGRKSSCPRCGLELSLVQHDYSGCPRCRAAEAATRAPPTTLSWGTLLLIGIVVSFFVAWNFGDWARDLRSSVDKLVKTSDIQTNEIKELRKTVEKLHQGGVGPGK